MPTMQHLCVLLVRVKQAKAYGISPARDQKLSQSIDGLDEAVKKDFNIFHSDTFMIPGSARLGPCTTHIHDTLDAILSSPDARI